MYMRITEIWIRNYRLIRDMRIRDIERALILVGKNNTGENGDSGCRPGGAGCRCRQDRGFPGGFFQYRDICEDVFWRRRI